MVIKNSIDSLRIPVLNGINYKAWRRHISYLSTHDKTFVSLKVLIPINWLINPRIFM